MIGYILKKGELNQILGPLAALFNIRFTFFDLGDHEMDSLDIKPMSATCARNRKNPDYDAKCIKCDLDNLARAKQKRDIVIYTCHGGLIEAVIPVYEAENYLGSILFGQIKPSPTPLPIGGLTLEEGGLPCLTMKQVRALAAHMKLLCEFILVKEIIKWKKADWFEETLQFLQGHLQQEVSLQDLSRLSGKSISTISHTFKKQTGQSPVQFHLSNKLMAAAKMIENGENVRTAALHHGFYDEYHFSKMFKKKYGKNPSDLKKLHRVVFNSDNLVPTPDT